ncbi:carboxymuconolactone decarboxylase family protein [Paenibacillus taichungensis]|uniref:Carboxymuconolactone decarboxylase family protein n=1 Tax=Paenibacillus taichungensis TaxID=484184 RepID=A0ABX2MPK0_9BACL|nr:MULTISPECIES: carboxymuconolactone decarboxylase family protein [Paenibacillus]MEC0107863.1 carboxymuconolactone decarboxylase family protein [Paenibacillus taichungensis]MEC0200703.1 carboxymuconolactone decarboxylase family protein [Paenibacillus taichungensis]NUU55949.1 carboxymuconolactone decarboxylase family protein [Paenibacillus taichungensis]SLJ90437.1 alkylhydroperoxidase AhpD family core domain-containing protein [Paenibacillus sp. RU5A]SOC59004.1 alkylhydroperoxidase AhpD family
MSLRVNYRVANQGAFKAMMALEQHISGQFEDKPLYELLKIRVSQINGCAFCLDMHAKDLLKLGDYADHILLLSVWREVPLFTEKERVMLELAEAVTLISEQGVPLELYEKVREHFSEAELVDLIMAINTINSWNRIAITTGMYPGCFN